MNKTRKVLIFVMLVSCFFVLISSVSAADYHVKKDTTQKDITKWMKGAKKGNSLVFDVSEYNLSDTLTVNKAIKIKSSKNTQINFNRNKNMFKVTSTGVTFSGLNLVHNGKGNSSKQISAIYAPESSSLLNINVKSTSIYASGAFVSGINIPYWSGDVSKSNIKIDGLWGFGVSSLSWSGDLLSSKVYANGNSSVSVYSLYYSGKVYKSKIYDYGQSEGATPTGVIFVYGKGTISKSSVVTPNGFAARLSKYIKISGSSFSSGKGYPKVYRFVSDLKIDKSSVKLSGSTYSFNVANAGLGNSKSCYLVLKTGKYSKKVKVKALTSQASTTVKMTIPKKYTSKKYTKTVTVDYYNVLKEEDRTNNVITVK